MTRITACLVLLLTLGGCDRSEAGPAGTIVVRHQRHMSTSVTISVAAPESIEVVQAIEAAFAEIARLTLSVSEWQPASEISTVNQQAGRKPVKLSEDPFAVLRAAHEISVASGGAFDVTCGALVDLWDFRSPRPVIPRADQIRERLPLVDYRQLSLDRGTQEALLRTAGMRIAVSGIAKGYIIDRASAVLKARGFANHLISAGGDIFASGRVGHRKWAIGIDHPRDKRIVYRLELENEGAATSGNYERFVMIDGQRYHHILDPRTGWPVRGLSSVTVVGKDATQADGFATAVFVLGKTAGLELARREGFEVVAFDEAFETVVTPGLRARLAPAGPSPALQ